MKVNGERSMNEQKLLRGQMVAVGWLCGLVVWVITNLTSH